MRRTSLFALCILALPLFSFAQGQEFTLARGLRLGMSGSDVRTLQEALSRIPDIYPGGSATGYFGKATDAAVRLLQAREGVAQSGTPGYGQVGPKTAAKINELLKKNSTSPVSTIAVSIPAAATTPASAAKISTTTATTSAKTATSTPQKDTTPPVRSEGLPAGVLTSDTTAVTISFTTNESARCYWSNTPGTSYDHMLTPFKATRGTKHTYNISSLSPGNYSFFVRCRDTLANTNANDYPILFSIAYNDSSGADKTPPRVMMSAPANGDSVTEGLTALAAAAADNAGVAGVRFFLNSQDLNFEDTRAPFGVSVMLPAGQYRAFAVARDSSGNRATSTETSFTVTPKPAAKSAFNFLRELFQAPANLASVFESLFDLCISAPCAKKR